jgi:hypothetical protein
MPYTLLVLPRGQVLASFVWLRKKFEKLKKNEPIEIQGCNLFFSPFITIYNRNLRERERGRKRNKK